MGLWPLKEKIRHYLTRVYLVFPSPDGVMAFKVALKKREKSQFLLPKFPSPDGVMAFKVALIAVVIFTGGCFRPLMGLWPLKVA